MDTAYPIHASSARLRLRVPARRHDRDWFEAAAAQLALQPGIRAVRCHPGRAGLTLQLAPRAMPTAPFAQRALRAAGISVAPRADAPRVSMPANPDKTKLTQPRMPRASAGLRPDRRTIALALFLLLLARHLLRNGWLAPGLALAWYLWERFPALRRR